MPMDACVRSENTNQNERRCANKRPVNRSRVSRVNNVRGRRRNLLGMAVLRRHLNCFSEHITLIANRLDVARFASAVMQALAQATYEKIDGAIEWVGVTPLGEIQQLIPSQDTLRLIQKDAQQTIFRAAQRDKGSVPVDQVPSCDAPHPIANLHA